MARLEQENPIPFRDTKKKVFYKCAWRIFTKREKWKIVLRD
jgi:hypothetical protein